MTHLRIKASGKFAESIVDRMGLKPLTEEERREVVGILPYGALQKLEERGFKVVRAEKPR